MSNLTLLLISTIVLSLYVSTITSISMGHTIPKFGPDSFSSPSSSRTRAGDPCAFVYGEYYTISYLNACYNIIPFNTSVANQTIATLLSVIEYYSYTPILRGPPSPYNNITVDLLQQLTNLRSISFTSDWDFQKSIIQLFYSIHDAHTIYTPPIPYTSGFVYRPFFLGYSTSSNGKLTYTLDYATSYPYDFFNDFIFGSSSNLTLIDLSGSQLIAINGRPADQWIGDYSKRFFYSKDYYANLNYVVKTGFTAIYADQGGLTDFPDFEQWTIQFGGAPMNFSFPLLTAWFGDDINTTAQFKSNFYRSAGNNVGPVVGKRDTTPPTTTTSILHSSQRAVYEPTPKWMEPYLRPLKVNPKQQMQQEKRQSPFLDPNPSLQIIRSEDYEFPNNGSIFLSYAILNGSVPSAVLRVNSFYLATKGEINRFINLLIFALTDASSRGISNLIIDVLDNGGGYVCLSQLLNNLFTADWIHDPTTYNTPLDVWYSPTFTPYILLGNQSLINSSVPQLDNWRNDVPYANSDLSWATNKQVNVTRGTPATVANYTSQFGLYCSLDWRTNFTNIIPGGWLDGSVTPPSFAKIIVLTDGTCGSACCQMSMRFQESGKVKVAVWGGAQGQPIETASFCGGAVEQWDDVYRLSINPINFVTTASVSFTHLEVFTKSDLNIPREWKRLDPDFRVYADGVSEGGGSYNVMHGATYYLQSAYDDYVNLLIRTSGLFAQFTGTNVPLPHSVSPTPTSPIAGSASASASASASRSGSGSGPGPGTESYQSSGAASLSPRWMNSLI